MPTYEYRCKACGEQLEVVQSFSDEPLTVHEACGGELRKVFHSVGIAFKGSGFYKTDSRGKSTSVTPPGDSGGSGDKSDTTAKPDKVAASGGDTATGASTSSGSDKPAATPAASTPSSS